MLKRVVEKSESLLIKSIKMCINVVIMKHPPLGTIVDNTVTRPQSFDFFIVSQSVRKGTVNLTCYDVIHDETHKCKIRTFCRLLQLMCRLPAEDA